MRLSRLFSTALALATGLALPASATTLTVSAQSGWIFGGNGYAPATITETTLRPNGLRVYAGGFAVQGDLQGTGSPQDFTAWCVDIATYLRLPSQYTTTAAPFASGPLSFATITNIERLFETGFKTLDLTNGDQSGGFQLALWEVLYETSGHFDLNAGNFTATNSTALFTGQTLLTGMSGHINQNYKLTFLQSDDTRAADGYYSQNLVTVAAVPLPAGGVLMIGGLGALAALRRRKARKEV